MGTANNTVKLSSPDRFGFSSVTIKVGKKTRNLGSIFYSTQSGAWVAFDSKGEEINSASSRLGAARHVVNFF